MGKNCSPNIVEYKGHGHSDAKDVFWLVMEKLQGHSLEVNTGISELEAIQVRFSSLEQFLWEIVYFWCSADWNRHVCSSQRAPYPEHHQ